MAVLEVSLLLTSFRSPSNASREVTVTDKRKVKAYAVIVRSE
jgi:hypothetical protein